MPQLRVASPAAVRRTMKTLAGLTLGLFLAGAALRAGPAPVRVVSQTVGTDELLIALAAPAQIAALSPLAGDPDFSAVPDEARKYPLLPANGDAESILKYNPTVVLCADYSRPELVTQLRRAGMRVEVFDHYLTLEDTYANIRRVARVLGADQRGEALIAGCEARVRSLQARLKGATPARVIAPSTYGLIPGTETTFQDLCDHVGAENLAATRAHLVGHAPQPSEQMLTWQLDYVVVAGADAKSALAPFRAMPPYQFMEVVRAGRVAVLPPYLISCVSHHRVRGYEIVARALHPEVFK